MVELFHRRYRLTSTFDLPHSREEQGRLPRAQGAQKVHRSRFKLFPSRSLEQRALPPYLSRQEPTTHTSLARRSIPAFVPRTGADHHPRLPTSFSPNIFLLHLHLRVPCTQSSAFLRPRTSLGDDSDSRYDFGRPSSPPTRLFLPINAVLLHHHVQAHGFDAH